MTRQFKSAVAPHRFAVNVDVPRQAFPGGTSGPDDAPRENARDLRVAFRGRHGFRVAGCVHAKGSSAALRLMHIAVSGSLCPRDSMCARREPTRGVGTRSGSRRNQDQGPLRSPHRRDNLFTPARVPERPRETLAPKRANGCVEPCSPVMAVGRSKTLPDPRPPCKPCQSRARKRKRRRGLSAAFPENQRAGCFRNRPGNSAGATLFEWLGSPKGDTVEVTATCR